MIMKGYRNLLILVKSEDNTYYIKVKHIQYIQLISHIFWVQLWIFSQFLFDS